MRILLIEDDKFLSSLVEREVSKDGDIIEFAETGEEGLDCISDFEYDVILLDLGLPDISGNSILRDLRSSGNKTPIVVLTGNDEEESIVSCLRDGADDYVVKPFNGAELRARLQAVTRRYAGAADNKIDLGDFIVDLDIRDLRARNGKEESNRINASRMEFEVVKILAMKNGRVVSRDFIYSSIYDYSRDDVPDPKIIDMYVFKIRNKMKKIGLDPSAIETIRGFGYRLKASRESKSSAS